MSYTATFSCQVGTTNADRVIGCEIWLDSTRIFNAEHVVSTETVRYEFAEDSEPHQLRFIIKNKAPEATEIDSEGAILRDVCVRITDLRFDDIAVDQVFVDYAVYHHDYNGTESPGEHKFYGELGCNGTVKLTFTTPIYLWLLEHM